MHFGQMFEILDDVKVSSYDTPKPQPGKSCRFSLKTPGFKRRTVLQFSTFHVQNIFFHGMRWDVFQRGAWLLHYPIFSKSDITVMTYRYRPYPSVVEKKKKEEAKNEISFFKKFSLNISRGWGLYTKLPPPKDCRFFIPAWTLATVLIPDQANH